jgi:hypothetical protein
MLHGIRACVFDAYGMYRPRLVRHLDEAYAAIAAG